jgi:hypothetical protein
MTSKSKTAREPWEPMKLTPAGNVGEVLQKSVGGGKSPVPVQPDFGMETPNSPPGQE